MKAVETDSRKQAMALREDTSTPQDQKREKMMAIRVAGDTKVRALLNDDPEDQVRRHAGAHEGTHAESRSERRRPTTPASAVTSALSTAARSETHLRTGPARRYALRLPIYCSMSWNISSDRKNDIIEHLGQSLARLILTR